MQTMTLVYLTLLGWLSWCYGHAFFRQLHTSTLPVSKGLRLPSMHHATAVQ